MAKATGIGGMFFRSDDPDALREWYSRHLGIDNSSPVWFQEAGPTVLMPFPRNTGYFGDESREWMLNFRVDQLDILCESLANAGIAVERRPDEWDSEVGRFARIHDPEGNPIELWEPAAPGSEEREKA